MPSTRRDFLGQAALGLAAGVMAGLPQRLPAAPEGQAEALRIGWPGVAGPH